MAIKIDIDPEIFREYDIRGITDTNLTTDVVYWIGRAFATEAHIEGCSEIVTGRDGRISSSSIEESLTRGLIDGGCNVVTIGQVTTPMLYYAATKIGNGTAIMITGSHNPPAYNGLKMMLDGTTLSGTRIQNLKNKINGGNLSIGKGSLTQNSISADYANEISRQGHTTRKLKVVIDCGNGVAGDSAPELIKNIGCEVTELYCTVDGSFPNHHPDPADPINLQELVKVVIDSGSDIGLAFDGDGDRLGVVTNKGTIIWPDKLMMLFAKHILSENPGTTIISDVKCSRDLEATVQEAGGQYIMWKTGHSHIKAKMKETNSLLGGEFSGHICFSDQWYGFDDATYSAARLLKIVAKSNQTAEAIFAEFPNKWCTPEIKIETTESKKFEIIELLKTSSSFPAGKKTTLDGIRIDYEDSWGLIRASNTSPVLSLRFEAEDPQGLMKIQEQFKKNLFKVAPELKFPLFEPS